MSLCTWVSSQYLPVPEISARHSPASGDVSVKIRPQFNSVISVLAEPSEIAPPKGWVNLSWLPLVSTENVNVIFWVTESTGIVMICGFPSSVPVAQNTVETLFLVDSRTRWKALAASDRCKNMGMPPVSLAVWMYVGSAGPHASGPKLLDRFAGGCVCPNPSEAEAQRIPVLINTRAHGHNEDRFEISGFIVLSPAPHPQGGTSPPSLRRQYQSYIGRESSN